MAGPVRQRHDGDMSETPHSTPQPPPQSPPPPAGDPLRVSHASDGFFNGIRDWGLVRDTSNRWFGGVCSGIARRFDVDPLLIRAGVLLLLLFGGVGLAAYLVAWLLLPDNDGRILGQEALLRGNGNGIALIVAICVVLAGGAFISDGGPFWLGGWTIPVALIAFILWRSQRDKARAATTPPNSPPQYPSHVPQPQSYAADAPPAAAATAFPDPSMQEAAMSTSTYAPPPTSPPAPPAYRAPLTPPPPPAPRRRRPGAFTGLITIGAAVVAYGIGYLLDGPLDFPGSPNLLGLLAALTTASLIAIGLGLRGLAGGAATSLAIFLAISAPTVALAEHVTDARGGAGDRTWVATSSNTETSKFQLGVGDATLDLRQLPTSGPASDVYASQGIGKLTILIPNGVTTRLKSNVGIGNIDSGSVATTESANSQSGVGQSSSLLIGEGPEQITVHVDLGIGTIEIKEG